MNRRTFAATGLAAFASARPEWLTEATRQQAASLRYTFPQVLGSVATSLSDLVRDTPEEEAFAPFLGELYQSWALGLRGDFQAAQAAFGRFGDMAPGFRDRAIRVAQTQEIPELADAYPRIVPDLGRGMARWQEEPAHIAVTVPPGLLACLADVARSNTPCLGPLWPGILSCAGGSALAALFLGAPAFMVAFKICTRMVIRGTARQCLPPVFNGVRDCVLRNPVQLG